jgi:hypothetical protein
MNVFISYSVGDLDLVRTVANQIGGKAKAFYWDKSKEPGKEVWPTIFSWIDASELVLVLITDKTIARAFAVGQEVGHAKKGKKQIIPLVAKEVPTSELGFLSGITYIPLDIANPTNALQTLQGELEKVQVRKQKQTEGVVVLAGLALILFLLSQD